MWEVSGTEIRLGSTSMAPSFHIKNNIYIFLEKIAVNSMTGQANYVSYLWFNSSNYEGAMSVTCRSSTSNVSISLEPHGTVLVYMYYF